MDAWKLGSTIEGKYRLLELLARGGQGEIYAAEHVHTGERVAVKCMTACVAGEPELVERMLHEARVTASLRHPNHVAIRDCNVVDGRVYIVMELLEGRDCRAVLVDDGPMSIGRAMYIVAEAAAGIAAAHEKWVVHRDLKPENVFVCTDNSVKVIDYGTSTSQSGGRWITQDGLIAGTLAYMAPERLAGAFGDERVDMFALGMILLELVLGRHPFAKGPLSWPSEAKLRKLMRQWDPEALLGIRQNVSADVWQLFAKATARDPEDRFVDMSDFRHRLHVAMEKAALAEFLPSDETPVRPVASIAPRGSERAFANRVLEQTPVMRPAVQAELGADTPVVTPIRYAALQQERELAKRSVEERSGFTTTAPGSGGHRLSDPIELPMVRVGRRAHIVMGLVGVAAALALVRSTSDLTRSAAAARDPHAPVQASREEPLSPMMATTQAAIEADWKADVELQNTLAATLNGPIPFAGTGPGRSSGKLGTGKRNPSAIDLARVSSGLHDSGPVRGRNEAREKRARKSADEFIWSRDDSVLEPSAQTKSSAREVATLKAGERDASGLLIRSLATSIGHSR